MYTVCCLFRYLTFNCLCSTEIKEAKQRKRQLQLQLRIEEQQSQAARIWNQEILPKWETMSVVVFIVIINLYSLILIYLNT